MLAYGYEWDSEEEQPLTLRETCLACTREELDSLIEMLQAYRDVAPQDGDHQHFRDWNKDWTEQHSDFIIYITDQPCTKENRE